MLIRDVGGSGKGALIPMRNPTARVHADVHDGGFKTAAHRRKFVVPSLDVLVSEQVNLIHVASLEIKKWIVLAYKQHCTT
jgi:hypothetical protein